jgi:hypothetical protein
LQFLPRPSVLRKYALIESAKALIALSSTSGGTGGKSFLFF